MDGETQIVSVDYVFLTDDKPLEEAHYVDGKLNSLISYEYDSDDGNYTTYYDYYEYDSDDGNYTTYYDYYE